LSALVNSRSIPLRLWHRLALSAVVLCFGVVVLGAYVRLTAAGLGCPDWPGCYGHLTPLGAEHGAAAWPTSGAPFDEGKAWREMIHRYAASTLGLLIVIIAALAIARRAERTVPAAYGLALLGIVVLQGALGMLTVTWQLKPLIVTLHLLFGMTTLSLLWWLWLSLPQEAPGGPLTRPPVASQAAHLGLARAVATLGLIVLVVQIALGGWTSSNYAAIACPDFPTCQGQWWPPMQLRSAFVLWHAPSINYEGGILQNAARVAIHVVHRVGALVTSLVLLTAATCVLGRRALRQAHPAAWILLVALALQLTIGITMVRRGFPLALATAHNAGAALTLLATIALLHRLRAPRNPL
jgi:cytochrome c oxidase assembly protein subunit 15